MTEALQQAVAEYRVANVANGRAADRWAATYRAHGGRRSDRAVQRARQDEVRAELAFLGARARLLGVALAEPGRAEVIGYLGALGLWSVANEVIDATPRAAAPATPVVERTVHVTRVPLGESGDQGKYSKVGRKVRRAAVAA